MDLSSIADICLRRPCRELLAEGQPQPTYCGLGCAKLIFYSDQGIATLTQKQQQQDVQFQSQLSPGITDLSASVNTPVYLSNDLFKYGLNRLTVTSGGQFSIARNNALNLPSGGQLSVQAGAIEVQGGIISIHLGAGSAVNSGDYVLLPAHYALLPGAYLLSPVSASTDLAPGTTAVRSDGTAIVAGYRFSQGSSVSDSHWSGFVVESAAVLRTRFEYDETTAGKFFSAATNSSSVASLPQDAGNLSLLATDRLQLAATVSAKAGTGGLGGLLDISANRLAVIQQTDSNSPVDRNLASGSTQ